MSEVPPRAAEFAACRCRGSGWLYEPSGRRRPCAEQACGALATEAVTDHLGRVVGQSLSPAARARLWPVPGIVVAGDE